MPVPRSLNSDCSTCVEFELNGCLPFSLASLPEKPEQIAEKMADGTWVQEWHSKN
jgi:hypothetical protein